MGPNLAERGFRLVATVLTSPAFATNSVIGKSVPSAFIRVYAWAIRSRTVRTTTFCCRRSQSDKLREENKSLGGRAVLFVQRPLQSLLPKPSEA
jgi:hypothetical protein